FRSSNLPERFCFQTSSSASCLNRRTRIGDCRSMSFSTIAWISFGGTGWLALALVASDISSVSQAAKRAPAAASATDVMSARTSVRLINAELHTHRVISPTPQIANTLKPLLKYYPLDRGPATRCGHRGSLVGPPWSTEDKYGLGAELRPKCGFRQNGL